MSFTKFRNTVSCYFKTVLRWIKDTVERSQLCEWLPCRRLRKSITMVGFLRVSEGAASLTSRPCLLMMSLGVPVGGSAGSTGAFPPPGPQLLAGQQGLEGQPARKWSLGYSRLLKGPSRAGAPLGARTCKLTGIPSIRSRTRREGRCISFCLWHPAATELTLHSLRSCYPGSRFTREGQNYLPRSNIRNSESHHHYFLFVF